MPNWKVTGNSAVLRMDCFSCDDASGHLYIYLGSKSGWCFRCSTWYSQHRLEEELGELPQSSTGISPTRSLEQIVNILKGRIPEEEPPEIELPESVSAWEDKRSRSYLRNRGVLPYQAARYNLRFCREGIYRNRVILPVYSKGKVRTFSARDITGNQSKKYLFPPGASVGGLLFNLDNARSRTVVVVEGQFDAIHLEKFGIPAVASFGKKLTMLQIGKLERFEQVVLLFDGDAGEETYRYLDRLPSAKAVMLPCGDPTDFCREDIIKMLRNRLTRLETASKLLESRG